MAVIKHVTQQAAGSTVRTPVKPADVLLAAGAVFFAVLMLMLSLSTQHMHPDETLVYEFTRVDIPSTVWYLAEQDVHPPLWFSFFWIWRQLVGDTEYAGRMQALLFSVLTLAMVYRLGRDWFGQARYGLFAVVVLAVSAYFVAYALEIRPYALTMLLASISMYVFSRWRERQTWRWAAAYAVVTALMLYVHYFLTFLIIAQGVYFFLRSPSRRLLMQGSGAALLTAVLFLPWLPSFLNQVAHLRQLAQDAGNSYGLGVGTPATTQSTNLETIIRLFSLATNGQPLLVAIGIVVGIVLLRRRANFMLALIWALGVPAVALILNLWAAVYTQRYVAYLTVGLALVLGAALASLPRSNVRWLALAAYIALNIWLVPQWLPVRIPHRDIFRAMNASTAGTVYFVDGIDQFLRWEIGQYLAPGFTVTARLSPQSIPEERSVWFVTGNWFDRAVQAQFRQIEQTHPLQQVIGKCDREWCYLAQLLQSPPLTEPIRFGDALEFRGADVARDSVGLRWGLGVDARLWWTTSSALPVNYSFSLRLVNSSGALIGQSDGAINHYGQEIVETSAMEAGRIYIDYRTLQFPEDTPAGMYELRLVVYDSVTGERLTMPGGSDSLLLQMLGLD